MKLLVGINHIVKVIYCIALRAFRQTRRLLLLNKDRMSTLSHSVEIRPVVIH
jgi:hypothetical protein